VAITHLLESVPQVIALGGGAFEDPSTRAALLARTLVVWLDVPEYRLVQRISGGSGRPLFAGQNIRERLAELAARRLPDYRQAHLRASAPTSARMTEEIVAMLQSNIAALKASP